MIIDSETNFLYLANTLPLKHSAFYLHLQSVLQEQGVSYSLLPNTKDIWAVDYMPAQVREKKFVRFIYDPDYLRNTITGRKTISDTAEICKALNIDTIESDILLDGGNVVKAKNKVILCDKVFKENFRYEEKDLIEELENLFEVDKLIFLPTHNKDEIGHADGMVRFLDDNTVLINTYRKDEKEFGRQCRLALHNAGLHCVEMAYNLYDNQGYLQANGIYINYLQTQQAIVIPTFGIKEDEIAFKQFQDLFAGQNLATIDSNSIAKDGGVLNCISWSIRLSNRSD